MLRRRSACHWFVVPAITLLLVLTSSCRDATGDESTVQSIVPSSAGAHGCSGPDQTFTVGQVPSAVATTAFVAAPESQIVAARGSELLYATGADATVIALDVTNVPVVELTLVSPGSVATALTALGFSGTPRLGGIAVLDRERLLVQELASNTILAIGRTNLDEIDLFAGTPNASPGFANGLLARFGFTESAALCPTGDGRIFVCDPGNHAIRLLSVTGIVTTLAGSGAAGFNDGDLDSTLFDTPTGLSVSCNTGLFVTEKGGNRVRMLTVGSESPVGGFFGASATFTGDGTAMTTGGPEASAQVAAPVAPFTTSASDVYWIDSDTGVLRRARGGQVDCPLATDCTSAVATPTFPAGHTFSMAATDAGVLFVLDATSGTLWRVTP